MTQSSDAVAVTMDWGGTWVRAAAVDRAGEILWISRAANPPGGDGDALLENAAGLLRQAVSWCGSRPVAGVGIAVAGPVDDETGTLYDPPNLPALDGVSLKSLWEAEFGYPVFVGNDANLAALGEFCYGAGREASNQGSPPKCLVYVTVSTGIGGGIVNQGQMLLGAHGLAGEVGHMVIDGSPNAPRCLCGNSGCLESLASGTAIARIARERLATQGAISVLGTGGSERITSEEVFLASARGDALAKEIIEDVVTALSVGLTNVLHIFNPDLIALGGGVTIGLAEAGLLPRIHAEVLDRAMSERHKDFRLVASRLDDAAGLVGAAGLVWQGAPDAA